MGPPSANCRTWRGFGQNHPKVWPNRTPSCQTKPHIGGAQHKCGRARPNGVRPLLGVSRNRAHPGQDMVERARKHTHTHAHTHACTDAHTHAHTLSLGSESTLLRSRAATAQIERRRRRLLKPCTLGPHYALQREPLAYPRGGTCKLRNVSFGLQQQPPPGVRRAGASHKRRSKAAAARDIFS